jgi:phosphoenolpyruvate synthase/pyruvate phosphate dikinase
LPLLLPRTFKENGENRLELYVVCEIPSNVLCAAEFAQFLVEQGIDSISLNPDAVLRTTQKILEMEALLSPSATGNTRSNA